MAVNLNDSVGGLANLGTEVGNFFTNITPGLVGFIATIGIVTAVVGVIVAVIFLIKKKINFSSK